MTGVAGLPITAPSKAPTVPPAVRPYRPPTVPPSPPVPANDNFGPLPGRGGRGVPGFAGALGYAGAALAFLDWLDNALDDHGNGPAGYRGFYKYAETALLPDTAPFSVFVRARRG